MSREDATYFFFEKILDLDTDLGISVSDDPQKIRPVLRRFSNLGVVEALYLIRRSI